MKRLHGWAYPDADDFMCREMTPTGGYQADHLARALGYVTDFSVAIDGGAHVGTWSRILAGRFARVLAFEPAEDTHEALVANMATFGCANVEVFLQALGALPGRASIAWDPVQTGRKNTGGRYLTEGCTVDVVPVDSLALDSLGFLKLDVEGSEFAALVGARETIARCAPIVLVENKALWATHFGLPRNAVESTLAGYRYRKLETVGRDEIWGPR